MSKQLKTKLGLISMASALLFLAGYSAQAQELRNLNNQFKSESGCPVEVLSAKTTLEIDPIGTPMACRIYIDYKNRSAKSISGVKFRIGYIDLEEKIRGTFHAPDGHTLEPGGTASAKWRGEKIDPRTNSVMIRVLVAKYSDGSLWESEKMKDLAPGTGGSSGSSAGSGAVLQEDNSSASGSETPALGSAESKSGSRQDSGNEVKGADSGSDSFETAESTPSKASGEAAPSSGTSSSVPEQQEGSAAASSSSKASPDSSKAPPASSTDGY